MGRAIPRRKDVDADVHRWICPTERKAFPRRKNISVSTLYISGSPRKHSNTDYLLHMLQEQLGGEFHKLTDYDIKPCCACWACRKKGACIIDDDMAKILMPRIFAADAIILGSPVYFNNVTAQLKAFIDRTWCLRGELRDKIGAAVVVGRGYGAESAITAINAFFLKHEMIVANRGISGVAFESGSIAEDVESIESVATLVRRLRELLLARDQAHTARTGI